MRKETRAGACLRATAARLTARVPPPRLATPAGEVAQDSALATTCRPRSTFSFPPSVW